jgi:hypothetical protein
VRTTEKLQVNPGQANRKRVHTGGYTD